LKISDELAEKIAKEMKNIEPKDVKDVAELLPQLEFTLGVGNRFAKFRCKWCLGPVRKIIWCIIHHKQPKKPSIFMR